MTKIYKRRRMTQLILNDPLVIAAMKRIEESGVKSESSVKREAIKLINQMAASYKPLLIRIYYMIMKWFWNTRYSGIHVDDRQIAKLSELSQTHAVVLTPNHKSHLDYLVLSYLFYTHHMPLPLIAAGANLSFWPLGYIFRNSGAFFIRRQIGDDPLYKAILRAYLKILINEKIVTEVFLEGKRSRSGKHIFPRTGLLSMQLETLKHIPDRDIFYIPISINYESLIEEKALIREQSGFDKQPENLGALLRIYHVLKRKYGRIDVNIGNPISAQSFLKNHSSDVTSFADHLMNATSVMHPVSAPALIATALLTENKKGMTYEDIEKRVMMLQAIITSLDIPQSEAAKTISRAILKGLMHFQTSGFIEIIKDHRTVIYHVNHLKRLHLDYYKNTLMDHFYPYSVILLAMKMAPVFKTAQTINDLFKHEFLGTRFFDQTQFDSIIQNLGKLNYKTNEFMCQFLASLLIPYFEGYQVVALALRDDEISDLASPDAMKQLLAIGKRYHFLERVTRYEALSKSIFENALLHMSQCKKKELNETITFIENCLAMFD